MDDFNISQIKYKITGFKDYHFSPNSFPQFSTYDNVCWFLECFPMIKYINVDNYHIDSETLKIKVSERSTFLGFKTEVKRCYTFNIDDFNKFIIYKEKRPKALERQRKINSVLN